MTTAPATPHAQECVACARPVLLADDGNVYGNANPTAPTYTLREGGCCGHRYVVREWTEPVSMD